MAEGPSIVTGHAEHMRRMPTPAAPADPLTVVVCGASGDLTLRKLMPALCALRGRGLLPEQLALVGVARRDWSTASFRARTAEGIKQFGNAAAHAADVDAFLAQVHYYQADLTAAADYQALPEAHAKVPFKNGKRPSEEALDKIRDEAEAELHGSGRIVLRPSGTEPIVRIMVQHDHARTAEELTKQVAAKVEAL